VKAEPAYKAELLEERKRREDLEKRVNDLVQENRSQPANGGRGGAELVDSRGATTLGVAKVDLAYRAVKDDIQRRDDGQLIARSGPGEVSLRDYLTQFVQENPELLPARMTGGSGMGSGPKAASNTGGFRSGQDSAGHESGRTGEGSPRGLESGESSTARHVRGAGGRLKGLLPGVGSKTTNEVKVNGSNYISKCSKCNREASRGGRLAGAG
jgi:hypothetical protein